MPRCETLVYRLLTPQSTHNRGALLAHTTNCRALTSPQTQHPTPAGVSCSRRAQDAGGVLVDVDACTLILILFAV